MRVKVLEKTSLLVEKTSFLSQMTSLYEEMAPFQILSPAAESFFTYFYNALRALNPIFGCPYELEDKRCALLCFELVMGC